MKVFGQQLTPCAAPRFYGHFVHISRAKGENRTTISLPRSQPGVYSPDFHHLQGDCLRTCVAIIKVVGIPLDSQNPLQTVMRNNLRRRLAWLAPVPFLPSGKLRLPMPTAAEEPHASRRVAFLNAAAVDQDGLTI